LVAIYLYCGTSIFSVVAVCVTQFVYIVGKPWVLADVRKAGSPAMLPLAYCPPKLLPPIQRREILQFGPLRLHAAIMVLISGLACWGG